MSEQGNDAAADRSLRVRVGEWVRLYGRRAGDRVRGPLGHPHFGHWLALFEITLVLPASVAYLLGTDERRKQGEYQAWQVVALADGQKWGGGRVDALQDLNRDGVSLRQIRLDGAFLRGASLRGADMKFSSLNEADLMQADLRRAHVTRAEARRASFHEARLHKGDFSFTDAEGARFGSTTACRALFVGATLRGTDFDAARLDRARFDGADLRGASFRGARLNGARFDGANLSGAIFTQRTFPPGMTLEGAKITGVKAPPAFLAALHAQAARYRSDDEWLARRQELDEDLRTRWYRSDKRNERTDWKGCRAL